MGIFFTLFYVFTAYIGTPVLFGGLAQYHIEIVIALLALLCSIPEFPESGLLKIPQTYGVIGLTVTVALSMVFSGWAGGAPPALADFIPNAMVFFFVLLNFKKKSHLQMLIGVLLVAALYTILRGYLAERAGDAANLYVITMRNSTGEDFYRIRGATFLNDPNDFGQFLVGLIPCMFIFWVKGKGVRNFLLVIVPIALLMCGMYLTHSRGGMIATMVVAAVAGRRKLGIVPSLFGGALLFVGLSLAGFSGGRDVSVESGADRMEAWSEGLTMIRAHPLFGVGFRRFTDFHPITAHNTVVVCAAELGLIGLFFWMLLVVPTVRDALAGIRSKKEKAAARAAEEEALAGGASRSLGSSAPRVAAGAFARSVPANAGPGMLRGPAFAGVNSLGATGPVFATPVETAETRPYGLRLADPDEEIKKLPDAEIERLSNLMLVLLAGFLTAGWFLSRAYTMCVFTNAGIVAVVYRMARNRGVAAQPMSLPRASRAALIASVALLIIVYIFVRVDHVLPK